MDTYYLTDLFYGGSAEAYEEEKDFESCVEEMKSDGRSDAEIASKLVDMWMRRHGYPIKEGTTVHLIPGIEATGLHEGEQYLDANYWTKCFVETTSNYSETFWSELFTYGGESHYRNKGSLVSNFIPDDPIHRFVLHFLRDWGSRLHEYILDEEIGEQDRILVLRKQVENFVFFSRSKGFGGSWKMYSEPDDLLRQALNAEGMPVAVQDAEGNPLSGLYGEQVLYRADVSIPKSAADGPKPDDQDKKIYHYIRRFAVKKLGQDKVRNSWTMVKGSFQYNSKNFRCYAFSGHGHSKKELHTMPLSWWNTMSGEDAWEENEEIHFANVDQSQFGHNLVLALFNTLRPFIEADLKKLALHIAFDETSHAESLIVHSRKDMSVLDYGEFYDYVAGCMNHFDDKIKEAVTDVLANAANTSSAMDWKDVKDCVTVGSKNKKFAPDKDKLKERLLQRYGNGEKEHVINQISERLCKISEKHLKRLEKEVDEMPNKFLTGFVKLLQRSNCGEDNVIGLVLRELLLQNCDCFLSVKVQFVALDVDNLIDGKPFCGVCARKVKFYSVLPQLLRAIGSTGKDFDQLALLFAKLSNQPAGNPSSTVGS